MGKILIINGANFSENALGKVDILKSIPITWDGGDGEKQIFYRDTGNTQTLSSGTDMWGCAKVDVSKYVGSNIKIDVYCFSTAFCLFVKENNEVIESFQTKELIEKLIPEECAYLLLSNSFKNMPAPNIYKIVE